MKTVKIVNVLLTRRCNLRCSYCAIVRNYKGMPENYPKMRHYHENEMSTDYVIEMLRLFKLHNPDVFIILYGGEPLLRQDLPDIVNYCNKENIHYTIITNNTPDLQERFEDLLTRTDYIQGLTSSVDPLGIDQFTKKKSAFGLEKLIQYGEMIKDVVAEITVSRGNVKHLYDTVYLLSEHEISSSITFIDIAKSPHYDFSNITDKSLLVNKSGELVDQIDRIVKDELDVHMGDKLLPMLLDNLPSEYDCEIENKMDNLTIDSDGVVRTCLRIRGIMAPKNKIINCFMSNGNIKPFLHECIIKDKEKYCRLCNWSCMMMSRLISEGKDNSDSLIHLDKRT